MAQWQFDTAHSSADFSVKHMMFATVRGSIPEVTGSIEFDPDNPAASQVEATLNAASISTGGDDRDNHLRSADFLDVENHPTITFKSTHVNVTGEGEAAITGDLTIRGVTKSVTLNAEFLGSGTNPWGQSVAGFNGSLKINREDFGLTWNQALEAGGVLVGKEVAIELNVQAVAAAEAETA